MVSRSARSISALVRTSIAEFLVQAPHPEALLLPGEAGRCHLHAD
jgi:hypothetical protein